MASAAPRSALLRQFRSEFDAPDTLHSSLTLARMNVTGISGGLLRAAPRCELWFENGSIHHGTCQLQLRVHRRTVEGTVLFSTAIPGTIGTDADGSVQGTVSWTPRSSLTVASYHRYSVTRSGRRRYRGTISPAVTVFSHLRLEPTLSCITDCGASVRWLAGVRQRLVLFERTHTEFYVEREVGGGSPDESVRVEGRASFYF